MKRYSSNGAICIMISDGAVRRTAYQYEHSLLGRDSIFGSGDVLVCILRKLEVSERSTSSYVFPGLSNPVCCAVKPKSGASSLSSSMHHTRIHVCCPRTRSINVRVEPYEAVFHQGPIKRRSNGPEWVGSALLRHACTNKERTQMNLTELESSGILITH